MLLSKTFNPPEPMFKPTVVVPAQPPPAGAVDNAQPFFQPQHTNQPTSSPATVSQQPSHWTKTDNRSSATDLPQQPTNLPATQSQHPAHRSKYDNLPTIASTHQPLTNQPATLHQQPSHRPKTDTWPSSTDQTTKEVQLALDSDMDISSDSVIHELSTGQAEEGELSDLDQDISVTDTDQASTEEQNYRETVRSYMGWTHIPDIDSNMITPLLQPSNSQ